MTSPLHPDYTKFISGSRSNKVVIFQPFTIHTNNKKNDISVTGRTSRDESVIVNITNFRQHFYINCAEEFQFNKDLFFREFSLFIKDKSDRNPIESIDLVDGNRLFYGYSEVTFTMFKIYLNIPRDLTLCKNLITGFYTAKFTNMKPNLFYDLNISHEIKFIKDRWFNMSSWCIAVNPIQGVKCEYIKQKECPSSVIFVDYKNILSVPVDFIPNTISEKRIDQLFRPNSKGWDSTPKIKLFVFDIEVVNSLRPHQFPSSSLHKISQISVMVIDDALNNNTDETYALVLTLNNPDTNNEECQVERYESERDLLIAFGRLLQSTNADIVSGYNSDRFDIPYIIERACLLSIKDYSCYFTKLKYHYFSVVDNAKFNSFRSKGDVDDGKPSKSTAYVNKDMTITMPGFCVLDVMRNIIRRNLLHDTHSYKLNIVSPLLLNDESMKKKDMPPHKIWEHHYGDRSDISMLVEYCMHDTVLTAKLINCKKVQMIADALECSRVVKTDINTLASRGKTKQLEHFFMYWLGRKWNDCIRFPEKTPEFTSKTFHENTECILDSETMFRFMRETNIPITGIPSETGHSTNNNNNKSNLDTKYDIISYYNEHTNEKSSYTGAVVLDMIKGFYPKGYESIFVLDYHSLYPRIEIKYNLCPSTIVPCLKELLMIHPDFKPDIDFFCIPGTNSAFISHTHCLGIVPSLSLLLLHERSLVKAMMKKEEDPVLKNVYDLRQLNIKIVTNSIYGLLGDSNSFIKAPVVAASVTAMGRLTIKCTQTIIEQTYRDARVVYGDTDSVFVSFKNKNIEEMFAIGQEISDIINLKKPLKLYRGTEEHGAYINDLMQSMFKQPPGITDNLPDWLEPEKMLENAILLEKKKYIAKMYQSVTDKGKSLYKGIHVVRSDTVELLRTVLVESLQGLFSGDNVEQSINNFSSIVLKYAAAIHADNRSAVIIPLSSYAKTCRVQKEEYSTVNTADTVRKRMIANKQVDAPEIGEKFRIIFCAEASSKALVSDKARSFSEFLQNPTPVDKEYYLNMLNKTVNEYWKYILDAVNVYRLTPRPRNLLSLSSKTVVENIHKKCAINKMFSSLTAGNNVNSEWRKKILEAIDRGNIDWERVPPSRQVDCQGHASSKEPHISRYMNNNNIYCEKTTNYKNHTHNKRKLKTSLPSIETYFKKQKTK